MLVNLIPRNRVYNILMEEVERLNDGNGVGGMDAVCKKIGIPDRTLYRILKGASESELRNKHGTGEWIKFSMLDRILCGLRKVHLFYVPPEQGGFKDIYDGDPTFADRLRVRDALSCLDGAEHAVDEIIAAFDRVYHQYHRTLEDKNELEVKYGNLQEKYDALAK